jgi:predicted histidine transporter YuiF (NhaC family)
MIPDISWIMFVAALAVLLGLFFTLKSFKMPSSFEENRKKREELRRKLAKSQTKAPLKK